ncbi:TMEM175 family protein [Lacticaseibacillus baoqingensis]|uniref:TMEM175 family protein n=1 Tax=Lacticaseibacillus baoqingensis TaxID=2486013 RepID=A0ABW4EAD6_9LACO|nr:TMEM175 family protein [Lacticaseibacillus baoqingensis]
MSKNRVEAFTDGVIAIIITIMVLELRPPAGGSFQALWDLRFQFLIYLVSFITLAVYWNNHHHLFQVVKHVDGAVLWANVAFLFAVSLFPFATAWVGERHLKSIAPELFYGGVVLLADITYYLLVQCLLRVNTKSDAISHVLGRGYRKPLITIAGNVLALGLGWWWAPLTIIVDTLLLLVWVVPERRIEQHLSH